MTHFSDSYFRYAISIHFKAVCHGRADAAESYFLRVNVSYKAKPSRLRHKSRQSHGNTQEYDDSLTSRYYLGYSWYAEGVRRDMAYSRSLSY